MPRFTRYVCKRSVRVLYIMHSITTCSIKQEFTPGTAYILTGLLAEFMFDSLACFKI